jgi:hypothetical protein
MEGLHKCRFWVMQCVFLYVAYKGTRLKSIDFGVEIISIVLGILTVLETLLVGGMRKKKYFARYV